MTTYSRWLSGFCVVLFLVGCLFSTTEIQAETIADIRFSESKITITTVPDFKNLSVIISKTKGEAVFSSTLSKTVLTLPLCGLSSIADGKYRLDLSAETGKISEITGRKEDGREAKKYTLKETVTQKETFQIVNKKILILKTIEE